MKYIIILIISSMLLFSSPIEKYYRYDPEEIILINNIDIDGKSIKGWIRIFNSEEKCNDYGFDMNESERETLLSYMREKQNKKNRKYKRGIR
jgi:hypothetical protein